MGFGSQYYATFFANIGTFGYGIGLGWVSPVIPLLSSKDTPLPFDPLTEDESSWIVAYVGFGGLLGTILYGWMVKKYGRKISLYATVLPVLIFWILVAIPQNVQYLYIARICLGFSGGGIFLIIPLYISEISDDKIRGTLGAMIVFACNFGIVVGYAGGAYIDYHLFAYLNFLPPIIFFIGFYRVPDSPGFYYSKHMANEAKKSLLFFNGSIANVDELIVEKVGLQNSVNNNNTDKPKSSKLTARDFCSPAARKAIIISTVVLLMTQLSGIFVLMNYASSIFIEAGSKLSPNDSSIVVGLLQFIGACASPVLADRSGRKLLLSLSSILTGICLLSMGFFTYFKVLGYDVSIFSWVPIAALSGTVFCASWGIAPMPFLIVSEILPQKTCSLVLSFYLSVLWIMGFLMLRYYSLIIETIAMHGCMWIFGGFCVFESFFVLLYMPETKGKSVDEIITILGGN